MVGVAGEGGVDGRDPGEIRERSQVREREVIGTGEERGAVREWTVEKVARPPFLLLLHVLGRARPGQGRW